MGGQSADFIRYLYLYLFLFFVSCWPFLHYCLFKNVFFFFGLGHFFCGPIGACAAVGWFSASGAVGWASSGLLLLE